jgi:uncharacterized coiled-coil DUF342 family protein
MQAELKKEITCVADACTEALGTTIRAEIQQIDQKFENRQVEIKKEMTEQMEESSKGLEKRQGEMEKAAEEAQEKVRKAAEEAQEKVCEVIIKVKSGCENKIATVEKELREKLNEGEMQMKAVQTELKEEITECRNIADKNVEDLEHSKTLLQNMQAELKKEITCVADACTEALGTTIRAEVSMPVLMCARFCVSLFVHVYLCVSPSLIHNPGHTHTHADTGDSTEFRE